MEVNEPTNVQAVATGPTSALVTWENAQTTHENNEVEYRNITDAGSWTTSSDTLDPDSTEHEVTGLTATKEYEFRVTALNTPVSQVTKVETVADDDDLNNTWFIAHDQNGSVAFWINLEGAGSEPAHGADRSVEVTVTQFDLDFEVAEHVETAANGDSAFSATRDNNEVLITCIAPGSRPDSVDNNTGFTITTETPGEDGDSDPVEAAQSVFTWPDTTGQYWAARIAENPSDWTHIINLTQDEPYLNGTALGLTIAARTEITIRPEQWYWGPLITKPAYPGGA